MSEQETEQTEELEQPEGNTLPAEESELVDPFDEAAAEDEGSKTSEVEPEPEAADSTDDEENPLAGDDREPVELEQPDDAPDSNAPARSAAEVMSIAEAIIFVSDEPITSKTLGEIIGEDKETVRAAVEELQREYEERDGGLQIREIAGGWQIATRTEYHEEIRKFLKTRPSAKLSLAALETLAVIAYKQPVTVPEILEIRGVQSASAIKTLLEKRLIVTKGHKETVGRPMMYGTSKDFLIQFGLKDLSDLPSIEDFEDLVQSN
jgi:segregation and condensation protein B